MSDRVEAAVRELVAALRDEMRHAAPVASNVERLLSIPEACRVTNLGRSLLYAEMDSGRLSSVKAGRRRLIPTSSIAAWIAAQAP